MAVLNHARKPVCANCGEQGPQVVSYPPLCRDCFRKQQEQKSIEERLLELEIGLYHQRQHQHVENMRF